MQHFIAPNQNLNTRKENKMENIVKVIVLIAGSAVIIIASGLLWSLPVMLLWNACVVAAIPGVKAIGWLQAWGILILCGLLFKNSSVGTKN